MKANLSTPQQGSTNHLTGMLDVSSAQLDTLSPSSKADIYATQEKYTQVRGSGVKLDLMRNKTERQYKD